MCIQVIQIDEAALREGLPLGKSEQAFYLDWAVHSFRITNCGMKDTTQTGSRFRTQDLMRNSSVFREGVKYGAGIGPGVYDIHSPWIPSTEEIADRITKMLAVLEDQKVRRSEPALTNMVAAAKLIRTRLASTN